MLPIFAQDIDPRWFYRQEQVMVISRTYDTTLKSQPINKFLEAQDPVWRVIDDVLALSKSPNTHGYTFQPSDYAINRANNFAWVLRYRFLRREISLPQVISDGEGGIDLRWKTDRKLVNLSVRSSDRHKDFIYWKEQGGEYDGKEATIQLLRDQLTWLKNDR